jgi:hypothetical protein
MDYGDEMNDQEELRYKKETYGDDLDEADEEGEEDGEQGEEESEEIIPLVKEFSRRANRGAKMQSLVNKAMDEEDDEFWGGIGAKLFGGSIGRQKGRD